MKRSILYLAIFTLVFSVARNAIAEIAEVKIENNDDKKVLDTVSDTAVTVKSKVVENANEIGDAIDVDSIVTDSKEFGKKVLDDTKELREKISDKASKGKDQFLDDAKELKEKILENNSDIKEKAKNNFDRINEKVKEELKVIKEQIKDTSNKFNNNTNVQYDWEDSELKVKREKLISDYKQAMTNEALVDVLRSKSLDARIDSRGIIINLENALFDFNSAELSKDALPHIKEISKLLQSLPDRNVSVEGHTDSVGTVMFNHKLSEGRAKSVVKVLVKNGVSRSRLEFKGYGESDPVATNRTEEGRNRNRRVELVIK